jgi:hypothetical protein
MTELNLETVLLCGVRVACDNVNSQVSMASNEAGSGARAVVLSFKRHLSSKPALPETDRGPRYTATSSGSAAPRAGRLADLSGGLVSRHPSTRRWSRPVGQAIGRICPHWLAPIGQPGQRLPGGRTPFGQGMQATLRGR